MSVSEWASEWLMVSKLYLCDFIKATTQGSKSIGGLSRGNWDFARRVWGFKHPGAFSSWLFTIFVIIAITVMTAKITIITITVIISVINTTVIRLAQPSLISWSMWRPTTWWAPEKRRQKSCQANFLASSLPCPSRSSSSSSSVHSWSPSYSSS